MAIRKKSVAETQADTDDIIVAETQADTDDIIVAETQAGDSEFVTVRACYAYMFEPFQMIPLHPGQPTPVRLTSWVESQIAAGHLERC